MKNIVYICGYMLNDVIKERNNIKNFSQAGNIKMSSIYNALTSNNCNVTIISHGWVNNHTFKIFKEFASDINNNVIYTKIIDAPVLNLLSAIYYGYKKVKYISKYQKIDYIIFYNFRPETACIAYFAYKKLRIPIVVEYEDGYTEMTGINGLKKWIFNKTEHLIKSKISGAILVTSKLLPKFQCKSIVIRGAINQNIIEYKKKVNLCKNNSKPILLYCGGLDSTRGIKILLEALNYTNSDFDLNIVGRGECENIVRENKDNRVHYLGYFINYEEVIEIMIKADILINPQLENHPFSKVSFPSKIFEYISTGNLIISSNISDIGIFLDGVISIYYNDNPKELAKLIDENIKILSNNELLKKNKEMLSKIVDENQIETLGKEICNLILS